MSDLTLKRVANATVVLSLLVVVYAIWSNRFLPFQDYPEWLFQSQLIYQEISGYASSDAEYTVSWFPLIPNVLVSLLLASMQFVLTVETAGKVFLSLLLLLFILGWWFLLRRRNPEHPLRWMGIPLAFNLFFYMGFLSYVTGVAASFFAVGWLFEQRSPVSRKQVIAIGAIAVLMFLIHGVAFGIFSVAVLVFLWQGSTTVRTEKILMVAALVPAWVLFFIYMILDDRSGSVFLYDSILKQIISWRYGFSLFHRLIPFESPLPVSYLNLLFLALISLLAGVTWRKSRGRNEAKAYRTLAWIMLGFVVLIPFVRIGDFYPPNPRFILPAAAFFMASIGGSVNSRLIEAGVALVGLVVVLLHAMSLDHFNGSAGRIYEKAKPYLDQSRTALVAGRGYAEEFDKQISRRFSGGIRTMVHFRRYYDLHSAPPYVRTFQVGLLKRNHTRQPDVTAIDSLLEQPQHVEEAAANLQRLMPEMQRSVDRVLVLGTAQILERFKELLNPLYAEEVRDDYLLVMVRRE